MVLKTQFEIDGNWTSVADGNQFLYDVAQETGTQIDVIGHSVQGREILALTYGTGDKKLLVTSGVHGTEPGSRETILMKARDMAYNINNKYTDYLSDHKVVIVPTLNPDRMHDTYRNAHNIDINRVVYQLDSPEGIAFLRLLNEFRPDIHVDHHERFGNVNEIQYVRAMHLDDNSDLTVRETIQNALDYVMGELESRGHTTGYYGANITGFGSLTSGSGILGTITFTPETPMQTWSESKRVDLQVQTFDLVLEWHANNQPLIEQMKLDFISNMLKPSDTFYLMNGLEKGAEFYTRANKTPIELPEGYVIKDFNKFAPWKEIYDIQVNPSGFIPVNQRTGRLLPHILDPLSDYAVVQATRIEPGEPIPVDPIRRTGGRYTKVLYDEWREVFIKYM